MPVLDERVDPLPSAGMFWEAFWYLSATRTAGPSFSNPISYQEMLAWATMNGYSTSLFLRRLAHYVRIMDVEWLRIQHEETTRERERIRAEAEAKRSH